jgi:hypothetical protein
MFYRDRPSGFGGVKQIYPFFILKFIFKNALSVKTNVRFSYSLLIKGYTKQIDGNIYCALPTLFISKSFLAEN